MAMTASTAIRSGNRLELGKGALATATVTLSGKTQRTTGFDEADRDFADESKWVEAGPSDRARISKAIIAPFGTIVD